MRSMPPHPTAIQKPDRSVRASRIEHFCRYALTLLAILALAACSGAGVGDGDGDGPKGATGSTSIFITDAPSDDFDRILITIESIKLIGSGGQVTIFSGSETIDLKALENFSDLFVHAEKVPARAYSKIRLGIAKIELVKEGPDGEIVEAELPGNGKIDLVPGGTFHVRKGINLTIEIDIEAKKSIHIVRTGNHRYRFRPVVKVTIRDTETPHKLARVHGEITDLFGNQSFELCSSLFMASHDVYSSRADRDEGGLGDRHRCMTVEYDDATGVFDSDGDPIAAGELMIGEEVTVIGRFHLVDASHDDATEVNPQLGRVDEHENLATLWNRFEHRKHHKHRKYPWDDSDRDTDTDGGGGPKPPGVDLVLLAYVVEAGPPGAFLRLRGVVDSEVDDSDQFDFAIDSGQGFGSDSVVVAQLQIGTRVFTRRGIEVDDSEIIPDTEAKIDGVFSVNSGDDLILKTALVVLDTRFGILDLLRGRITEINAATRQLILEVEDDGAVTEECVNVPEATDIFLLYTENNAAVKEDGSFEDLMVGWKLRSYGQYGDDDCLVSETILAFP